MEVLVPIVQKKALVHYCNWHYDFSSHTTSHIIRQIIKSQWKFEEMADVVQLWISTKEEGCFG